MSVLKRIAIIRNCSSVLNINSYNVQEIGLAKSLANLGYEVDIFMMGKEKKDTIVDINNNVKVIYLTGFSFPGQNGFFPQIFRYIQKGSYTLIQVSEDSQIMSVLISMYCKIKGIPVFLWQGMYASYTSSFKKKYQQFYDFIFLPILRLSIQEVLCKTSSAKKYVELKKFNATRIVGVGLDAEKLITKNINWYKALNIKKEKKILLYIGKLEDRRNPLFLLDIVARLKRNDFVLVIVGKGPLKNAVLNRIIELKISQKIRFLKEVSQEDIGDLYRQAFAFVLPSKYEIFGMVILECMYCGCPVISSNSAGAKDLISNGVDGYIVDSIDCNKWVDIIEECFDTDIYRWEKICSIWGKKFQKKYSWEKIAKKYHSSYRM